MFVKRQKIYILVLFYYCMTVTSLERFAKGRVSMSQKIIKEVGAEDGTMFKAEAEGKKILLTKIEVEDIKTK